MAGKPRDRVGEVYGELTIISISEKRSKSGAAYWNAQCSCGEIRNDIPGDHLFHGKRKSRSSVSCCLKCARQLQSKTTMRMHASSEEKRRREATQRRIELTGKVEDSHLLLPLTKQDAIEKNQSHYFNGIPCKAGHLDRRGLNTSCMECRRLEQARRNATPEGKAKNKSASKKRWADPAKREQLQKQRAEWARSPEGRESLKRSYKSFYDNNRDRVIAEKGKRSSQRYKEDTTFRLRKLLARRISLALKDKDITKDETTLKLVGCSVKELVQHFENQFEDWMTWENMGEWHIDHVRPCASFDLSDKIQQHICFNWRNLQPLEGGENTTKKDIYDSSDEFNWVKRMHQLGFKGELFLRHETDS